MKKKIREDHEPIDVEEEDKVCEEITPSLANKENMSKNYQKFLALGNEAYYGLKSILKGRVLNKELLDSPLVRALLGRLIYQASDHLLTMSICIVYENGVIEVFVNLNVLDGGIVISIA
ncbi:hypothetical protein BC332_08152 [Capsicum chinense]|nr:hypothetical protein BC332_08152 [Capsicum chinense]